MNIIVTDTGFSTDTNAPVFTPLEEAKQDAQAIDLPNTLLGIEEVKPYFTVQTMRIPFPSSADGRGFSIARQLRLHGYTGTLRAQGHVLADQYAMARRSGFDEVEIDDALASRQPEDQWLFRANWQDHDYQNELRTSA